MEGKSQFDDDTLALAGEVQVDGGQTGRVELLYVEPHVPAVFCQLDMK